MFPVTVLTKVTYWDFEFQIFEKKKRLKCSLIWWGWVGGFYAREIFKMWCILLRPPMVGMMMMIVFRPAFFWMFPVTVLTKVAYRYMNFENSNFIFLKIFWNSTLIAASGKVSNRYVILPVIWYQLFQPNFLRMFPTCGRPHKTYLLGFIWNFNFF